MDFVRKPTSNWTEKEKQPKNRAVCFCKIPNLDLLAGGEEN